MIGSPLLQDLRYGWRTLRRAPLFTVAALIGLTLGVGGPAAIFGAVRGMLLKPLPYPDADRLVFAYQHNRAEGVELEEVAPANFLDWRERTRSFEGLAAIEPYGLDWLSDQGPVYLETWLATEGFFDLLRAIPLLGRTFTLEEHARGRGDVVVLGYGVWRNRFGGDSTVIGRVLSLDGRPTEVIGVMPEAFALPTNNAVWAPKVYQGWEAQSRGATFYTVVGRLRDGVELEQAHADLETVATQLALEYPETNAERGVTLVSLPDQILGSLRGMLGLLFGAVVLVFLIACANLGNLQLARALKREHEFALRGALGAGRGRVVRQLVTESLLLAGTGCVLGFLLSGQLLAAARTLAPADLPRLHELRADGLVLLFSIVAALVAAVLTGILPARVAARSDLRSGLSTGERTATGGRRVARARDALVIVQVAATLVLLIGAGLLLRSFSFLVKEDRGFRAEGVAVLTVQTWSYIQSSAERIQFVEETTRWIGELPGIRAAAVGSAIPLGEAIGAEEATFTIPARPVTQGAEPGAQAAIVTPDYFRTLGVPLLQGRTFTPGDNSTGIPVAVVNRTFARRAWPEGTSPIGEPVHLTFSGRTVERRVVGVVSDVRRTALHQSPGPQIYVPFAQSPTGANAFFVWTEGDPKAASAAAKQLIWDRYPTMPVYREATLEEVVGNTLSQRRFLLALLIGFAALALALAVVGIFGVVSYAAAERTREIGVRIAFGAERSDVVALVVRHGIRLAGSGIVLGLVAAFVATRYLESMLYGVRSLDPVTFLGGAGLLLVIALIACWAPATQAARLDPVRALA